MIEGTGVRESQRSLQSGFRHSKRLRPDFPCKDDLWLVGLHNPQAATLTIRTRESAGSIVPLVLRMYGVAVSTRLGLKKKTGEQRSASHPRSSSSSTGFRTGYLTQYSVLRPSSVGYVLRSIIGRILTTAQLRFPVHPSNQSFTRPLFPGFLNP